MEIKTDKIDGGKAFDWGKTSSDYASTVIYTQKYFMKRLLIRELAADDWMALRGISEDFRKSEYAVYDMPLPVEDEKIKSLCEQFAESGLWFAIMLNETMIGYICFHENNGAYDLGFCFHSDYQGKG